MKNPYELLTTDKFWKTAVATKKVGEGFDNLWVPKFNITKNSKIFTMGSCFAQHISYWLRENGYSWQDAEPAPSNLSDDEILEHGYGIYSCRVGNIYTPAMLRQWIKFATGEKSTINEIYVDDNKYFDPLRPQIPKKGYSSKSELLTDRIKTLNALEFLLNKSEIFIFTMGLSEAWINDNGFIYQVCPGTIRGDFNSEIHKFKNYTYEEILDDMVFIIEEVTKINKNIKFLLTVSPVPLTATASDNHVLAATIYSKSILRAVAGRLSDLYNNVDYFPSYEIIASNASRINFFEENLRSVKSEGVEFVMRHFGVGVGAFSKEIFLSKKYIYSSHEEFCDEYMLENWNNKFNELSPIEYCLIGDSHMGKLSKAFSDLGVKHVGGMVMNGSAWVRRLLHLDKEEIFVPLENAKSRRIWSGIFPYLQYPHKDIKIIINLGMQTHMSVSSLMKYMSDNKISSLTSEIFNEYFLKENFIKIEIVKKLIKMGHHCLVVSDPPTRSINKNILNIIEFWNFYDKKSLEIFQSIGCDTLNAGVYFGEDKFEGRFYSEVIYADGSRDWFHGSDDYYLELSKVIKENCFK
jgi:hypothetical protein